VPRTAGTFYNLGDVDVIALCDDELFFLEAVAKHDIVRQLPGNYSDALALPDPNGGLDLLMVAGPSGAALWTGQQMVLGNPPLVALPQWANATLLRRSGSYVYGYSSNNELLLAKNTPSGLVHITALANYPLVSDIHPMDWDTDGEDELVFLDPTGVHVISGVDPATETWNPTTSMSLPRYSANDMIAVSRAHDEETSDVLAHYTEAGGTGWILASNSGILSGLGIPETQSLLGAYATHMAVGDVLTAPTGATEDLLLSHSVNPDVTVLSRLDGEPSTFWFTADPCRYDLSDADAFLPSVALTVDLDGDGDTDSVFSRPGRFEFFYELNQAIERDAQNPAINDLMINPGSGIDFTIDAPNNDPSAEIEIEIYSQASLTTPLSEQPDWEDYYLPNASHSISIPSYSKFNIYQVHVREVVRTGGVVQHRYPVQVFYFTEDLAKRAPVADLPQVDPESPATLNCPICGNATAGPGIFNGSTGRTVNP